MKVHVYKNHKVKDHKTVLITGFCGGITILHALRGEDIHDSIQKGYIQMFTHDPNMVTCGSCLRSKKFPLLNLGNTIL